MSFAGIARTDVAVGTVSDASMLCTTRALTPRIGSRAAAPGVTSVGIGLTTGSAGVGVAEEFTGGCEEVVTVLGAIVDVVGAGAVSGAACVEAGVAAEDVADEDWAMAEAEAADEVGVAGAEVGEELVPAAAGLFCGLCDAADFGTGGVPPRGAPANGASTGVDETVAAVGVE